MVLAFLGGSGGGSFLGGGSAGGNFQGGGYGGFGGGGGGSTWGGGGGGGYSGGGGGDYYGGGGGGSYIDSSATLTVTELAGVQSGNGEIHIVPISVLPNGPGYLTNLLSGTTMNLSWPAGQGWRLQAQTNQLNIGISNDWADVTDGSVNSYTATVNPTNPAVFYRLTFP